MCRPELSAQVRVFATGNGGKTDPSTRTPSREHVEPAEPNPSPATPSSSVTPTHHSRSAIVSLNRPLCIAPSAVRGSTRWAPWGETAGCSSGGKGELSPVVVVMPGRVVIEVLDGHVLLEVGVPAHREVHAPPELGVGVLLETRHQVCNDEVERLVHSGVAENSRAAEGSHVVKQRERAPRPS